MQNIWSSKWQASHGKGLSEGSNKKFAILNVRFYLDSPKFSEWIYINCEGYCYN